MADLDSDEELVLFCANSASDGRIPESVRRQLWGALAAVAFNNSEFLDGLNDWSLRNLVWGYIADNPAVSSRHSDALYNYVSTKPGWSEYANAFPLDYVSAQVLSKAASQRSGSTPSSRRRSRSGSRGPSSGRESSVGAVVSRNASSSSAKKSGSSFDWLSLIDKVLFGGLAMMLFIAWFIEYMPGFGPVNGTLAIWEAFSADKWWPPRFFWNAYFWWGQHVDPMYLVNPLWMKITSIWSPLGYTPLYIAMLYGFWNKRNWVKYPALVWAGSAWSFAMLCYLNEVFDPTNVNNPAFNFVQMTLSYVLYLTLPLLLIWRVCRDRVFA
eukprot:TRINITY_DN4878_c0_g1_i2.p2 TRINITY_DN4878_c0_g1~~TRINITY_DN4878_c0_g1_i2.p2  ORF type:complete len:326 (+),score=61.50 TRINITY_DN4878_c0_g1_i2:130-1107(+)